MPAPSPSTRPGKFAYVANDGSDSISAFSDHADRSERRRAHRRAACRLRHGGTIPLWVTVDPSGKFVYVANESGFSVSAYKITPGTGALTAVDTVPAGISPVSVAIDSTGKFAYVANAGSNNVSAYSIDRNDRSLEPPCPRSPAAPATEGMAMTKGVPLVYTPKFAYVTNVGSNNVSAYTINPGSGCSRTSIAAVGCNARLCDRDQSRPRSAWIPPVASPMSRTAAATSQPIRSTPARQRLRVSVLLSPQGPSPQSVAWMAPVGSYMSRTPDPPPSRPTRSTPTRRHWRAYSDQLWRWSDLQWRGLPGGYQSDIGQPSIPAGRFAYVTNAGRPRLGLHDHREHRRAHAVRLPTVRRGYRFPVGRRRIPPGASPMSRTPAATSRPTRSTPGTPS